MNSFIFCAILPIIYRSFSAIAFDPQLICSLLANGTKIKDPRSCNTWIDCINGKEIRTGTCPDDRFYDRQKELCVELNKTTCLSSSPCATNISKIFVVPDPYSCSRYYVCNNGTGYRGECPNNMNYNPSRQDCMVNFPCIAANMNPDSICNIIPDGVFVKSLTSCKDYQLCWKGRILNGTCPHNFYYNSLTGYCDYPWNIECATDIAVHQPSTTPPPNASVVCTRNGIFLSDGKSCNGYYVCWERFKGEMALVHATCPDGRFFDANKDGGACVDRTDMVCPFDRCAGLGSTIIQLSNLSGDGCHGFAICENGVTIGKGNCPNGEYFDEIRQRCTTQKIDFPACSHGN